MAQRLAIERSHQFASIAVVAASLSKPLASRFIPSRPMPILFINGTADPVTPYEGGRQPGGAKVLSVEDAVKMWANFNGCKKSSEVQKIHGLDSSPLVSVFTYAPCQNRTRVKLYRIEGGGHVWLGEPENPCSSVVGKMNRETNASIEIWTFFKSIMD